MDNLLCRRRTVRACRELAAPNSPPRLPPSSLFFADTRCGSSPSLLRHVHNVPARARRRPRLRAPPRRSTAAQGEPDRFVRPPSPSPHSSKREAPRACDRARIIFATHAPSGSVGANRSPLSALTSGRVHPNPFSSNPKPSAFVSVSRGPNACVMSQRGPGSLDHSDSSTVMNNISIKKDAGRSARPASSNAPRVDAPGHECRRDWAAGVSGQANVLFLF